MGATDINEKNKRPLHGVYAGNSEYNAINQQIEARLQKIETMFLGRVDSCQSSGVEGSKTVSATPLTQMVDGNGNAYASPAYPALPHYRIQQGTAAIIMDPRPGDIGVFVCSKRDISNVSQGKQPGPPGSTRSFSPSDAVMVGSIHTQVPTYYIDFTDQDKILIHAPAGVTIESDAFLHVKAPEVSVEATNVTVKAPEVSVEATNVTVKASTVTIDAPETTLTGHLTVQGGMTVSGGGGGSSMSGDFTLNGSMHATNDVTASGISLNSHVHGGVQTGEENTSGPR